jgi:sterol desaturase/sphingolipid hydroxylase (fatty acid hydroxylase superfamily)
VPANWTRLESPIYWSLFVGAFLAVAIWESFLPQRKLSQPTERRWSRHGILFVVCAVVNMAALRMTPVAMAALVSGSRYGVLNRESLSYPLRFAATILLLDLLQYTVHRTLHSFGFLWRIHAVHHSDPDYDVSTAARFHPLELIIVQGSLLVAVALLAPPLLAVFVTELLRVVVNLAEHANASFPPGLERILRMILITPDLHRIHHSDDEREQGRNLGQIFPWWDRLFGTYLAHAGTGKNFATGLKGFQNSASMSIGFMLGEPFHRQENRQKDPA